MSSTALASEAAETCNGHVTPLIPAGQLSTQSAVPGAIAGL